MSFLKKLNIGRLKLKNNIFLAPMAGFTDSSFRIIAAEMGIGLSFTEMISSYSIVYSNKKTEEICIIRDKERPVGMQLFGGVPEIMADATARVIKRYKPDLIDINAGCPVPKVMKSGAGSKLLEDPQKLYLLVKAVVDAAGDTPVTIKLRLGLKENSINILETSHAAQEAGAKLITLHPRTAQGKFSGPCRWEYIGILKERLKVPVCGNGEIKTHSDAIRMVEQTGCDAVMIGRASIGNPWILKNCVKALLFYPEDINPYIPSPKERIKMAIRHLKLACEFKGELRGIREMRRVLPQYIKGFPNSSAIRNKLVRLETIKEIEEVLNSVTENLQSG